jgi:hypothetical protein
MKHSRASDIQAVLSHLASQLAAVQPLSASLEQVPPDGGETQQYKSRVSVCEHLVALLRCLLVVLESEGGPRLMRVLSASAVTLVPILAHHLRAIAPHLQQRSTTPIAASALAVPVQQHAADRNVLASAAALCLRCLETLTARVQVFEPQHVHVPTIVAAAADVSQHLSGPAPAAESGVVLGPGGWGWGWGWGWGTQEVTGAGRTAGSPGPT